MSERGREELGCGMGWAEVGWWKWEGVGLGVLVRMGTVGVGRRGCRQ